jgi:Domain of unknown function (DUF4214)
MESYRPRVESLEERCLLAVDFHYLPVLPNIDAGMKGYLQGIYSLGQKLGNRANVFMKVGDSNSVLADYLDGLGAAWFNPSDPGQVGSHTDLASTINYFRTLIIDPYGANSFDHGSTATSAGWSSTDMLTPALVGAHPPWMPGLAAYTPLAAEMTQSKPAIALIMVGSVDVVFNSPSAYQSNLTTIIQDLLSNGVIPVVSTIPEDFQSLPYIPNLPNQTARFNQIIADVTQTLQVPLWNLYMGLDPLYREGVSSDNIHLSSSPNGSQRLGAVDTQYGMNYRNLSAVQVLQKIVNMIEFNGPADAPPVVPTPYLAGLFASILKRPIDAGGLAAFSSEITAGVAPSQVVQQIWTSPEHRQLQINLYYQQYLHRAADGGSVQYWIGQFSSGLTEFQMQAQLLGSPEYLDQFATAADFVSGLYQDVLSRSVSAGDQIYWTNALNQGVSRSYIAGQLVLSAEAAASVVGGFFKGWLGRAIDAAGFQMALSLIGDGSQGYLPVAEMVLTSQEYLKRT